VSDEGTLYRKLCAETAQLLGLDVAALTTAQAVRVDLVASLRLALDHFTALQLRGEQVDVGKMLSCAESLERLLPRSAAFTGAHKSHLESARAKFTALIDSYANEYDRAQDVEIAALKAEIAELQTRLSEKDAVISALGGQVAAASPAPPASPPAPQQRSNQPPLGRPDAPIPRHYLRDGQPPSPLIGDGRGYDRWSNNR
jgi:hypothetical protein